MKNLLKKRKNWLSFFAFIAVFLAIIQWSPVTMYRIVTPSMEPNILVNDVVIIYRWVDKDEIEVGDIIAFKTILLNQQEAVVVHYVHSITEEEGQRIYQTIAQGQTQPDRWEIPQEDIVGTFTTKIRGLGRLLEFFNSLFGQIVLLINLAIIFLWIYLDDKDKTKTNEK
jgi:signal peptidase I